MASTAPVLRRWAELHSSGAGLAAGGAAHRGRPAVARGAEEQRAATEGLVVRVRDHHQQAGFAH